MAILVVCPTCRKRFQVSEQFAGRTGPCPSCKAPIKIPAEGEEVKIHAPEEFSSGGKTVKGTLVLKPVARQATQFRPAIAAAIAGAVVVVLVLAMAVNRMGVLQKADSWAPLLLKVVALIVLTPPLVVGGYSFLRDDELEPYEGRQLYARAAAVAVIFIVLWGLFGRFGLPMLEGGETWMWLLIGAPFVLAGSMTASACLDIEGSSGALLYSFYLLVTILLRGFAGGGWIWTSVAS